MSLTSYLGVCLLCGPLCGGFLGAFFPRLSSGRNSEVVFPSGLCFSFSVLRALVSDFRPELFGIRGRSFDLSTYPTSLPRVLCSQWSFGTLSLRLLFRTRLLGQKTSEHSVLCSACLSVPAGLSTFQKTVVIPVCLLRWSGRLCQSPMFNYHPGQFLPLSVPMARRVYQFPRVLEPFWLLRLWELLGCPSIGYLWDHLFITFVTSYLWLDL